MENINVSTKNPQPMIVVDEVSYAYPRASERTRAVDDISFRICQGEMVAILGHNGAGKSTLAKLMMGLIKPESGQLYIAGRNVREEKPQTLAREIGFVFQNPEHQFLTDTVYDELSYSLVASQIEVKEIENRVERIAKTLDLEELMKDHPFSLSAGNKRRLGVATMLVSTPKILVVDEPTYGQDRAMTKSMMDIMLRLQQTGTTIVMITHDMRLVETYIPRCIVMADGKLIFDGDTADLFNREYVLNAACLRVTSLHAMINQLQARHIHVPSNVTRLNKLIEAFSMRSNNIN